MKILEHSQIDDADRRAIERIVECYRINTLTRHDIVSKITLLGFEKDSVERYVSLLDSTLA